MVLHSACRLAALAKQTPEIFYKMCFHWSVLTIFNYSNNAQKSLLIFYITYFQSDLVIIWANFFLLEKHSI